MTNPFHIIALFLSLTLGACIGCPAVAPTQGGVIYSADKAGALTPGEVGDYTPIEGAKVQLFENDVLIDETVTGEGGYYYVGFGDACEDRGTLEVRIEAAGHQELIVEFSNGDFNLGLVSSGASASGDSAGR